MAQNITLLGASYTGVPGVELPKTGGGTALFTDLTGTTATASDVASGKVFYLASGAQATGTGTGGGGVSQDGGGYVVLDPDQGAINITSLSVTANGTYTAPTNTAYDEVSVNVSGGGASEAIVTFIDYDGAIVESYTAAEWAGVSALPANPSHTGLTAQGWNWTKAQIDAYLVAVPNQMVTVGQMYTPTSGQTEIDIVLDDADYLSPYVAIAPTQVCTIDWGDGTTSTTSGTSATTIKYTKHTYASVGNYTISISGNFAFYNNSSSNPGLMTAIDDISRIKAYTGCVRAVRVGPNATLGANAFCGLERLETLTIPSAKAVGNSGLCQNCYSLKSLTIPSGITFTSGYLCAYAYALKNISLSGGLTSVGAYSFRECNSLESVCIPIGVGTVTTYLCAGCRSLSRIALPSGVTVIDSYAFQNCDCLQAVDIPNTVTSIMSGAFNGCYSLEGVTLPSGLTTLGSSAFYNCSKLQQMSIPDSVNMTNTSAFSGCRNLRSVTLPSGMTTLPTTTFNGCSRLHSVELPSGITSIGSSAFSSCTSLAEVNIPSGVTQILANAFASCSVLRSLDIPAGVASIGNQAFQSTGCIEYHFRSTTPPTLGSTAFSSIAAPTKIYVPAESLEAYQTASNWSIYADYMVGE